MLNAYEVSGSSPPPVEDVFEAGLKMPRGKSGRTLALIDAAVQILEEIQPATVRAVCHRLFALGHIKNMSTTESNKVSRHLTHARERGDIPWEWIVDETRRPLSSGQGGREVRSAARKGHASTGMREPPDGFVSSPPMDQITEHGNKQLDAGDRGQRRR
jgi:hypothetical protein